MTRPNVSGPIIVWENHGYNSWMPKSYPDMRSALIDRRYDLDWVITEVRKSQTGVAPGPREAKRKRRRSRVEDRELAPMGISFESWYARHLGRQEKA